MNSFDKTVIYIILALAAYASGLAIGGRLHAHQPVSTQGTKDAQPQRALEQDPGSQAPRKIGPDQPTERKGPQQDSTSARASYLADLIASKKWGDVEAAIKAWVRSSPLEAIAWANSLPDPVNIRALTVAQLAWFETKPDDAYAWSWNNSRTIFQNPDFYDTLASEGRLDLGVTVIGEMTPGFARTEAVYSLADSWAHVSPASAQAYTLSLSGEERQAAAAAVVGVIAPDDLLAAIQWANGIASNSGEKAELYASAAKAVLTAGEVSDLEVWANGVAIAPEMNGVYKIIAEGVAYSDPQAAVAWLQKEDVKDVLASNQTALSFLEQSNQPQLALPIIEASSFPMARDNNIKNAVLTWAALDPQAALNYANSTQALSPAAKTALLTQLATKATTTP